MTPEQQQLIEQLKRDVAELKRWKEEKERQQIKLPLDSASAQVLIQAGF
jgi:hypothetical protein